MRRLRRYLPALALALVGCVGAAYASTYLAIGEFGVRWIARPSGGAPDNCSGKVCTYIDTASVGHFTGGWSLNRTPVADAAHVVATGEYLISYTSLSATRAVTLPLASTSAGRSIVVADESGSASTGTKITALRSGSDTVNGSTSAVDLVTVAYGHAECLSDGGAKWNCYKSASFSGGGGGSQSLQDTYDNTTAPARITESDAISTIILKGDPNGDNILNVEHSSGTVKLVITDNGDISAASNASLSYISSSGDWNSPTGTTTLNGPVSIASGVDVVAAGGASDLDFSASSGVCKTPTGVLTINSSSVAITTDGVDIGDATHRVDLFSANQTCGATSCTTTSGIANSGTNVAHVFDTSVALSGTTRIQEWRNNNVVRCAMEDDGEITPNDTHGISRSSVGFQITDANGANMYSGANSYVRQNGNNTTVNAGMANGATAAALVVGSNSQWSTAGATLIHLNNGGGVRYGVYSGATNFQGAVAQNFTADTSGTTANKLVVWSGAFKVQIPAATANLHTVAGVALETKTNGQSVIVGMHGAFLVGCTGTVNAGDVLVSDGTTAGNVLANNSAAAGTVVGKAMESCGGTVANQVYAWLDGG